MRGAPGLSSVQAGFLDALAWVLRTCGWSLEAPPFCHCLRLLLPLMLPFPHGWEFSQPPVHTKCFLPVCSIRRGRIGPSADNLKGPLSWSEPSFLSMNYPLPGVRNEGRGCFHQLLQWGLFWRITGEDARLTSDLGACELELDYCQAKSKGKDGQDQTMLEAEKGEAIEMRVLLRRAGREWRLVLLWPKWTLGVHLGEVHLQSKPGGTAVWTCWRAHTARQADLAWNRLLTPCYRLTKKTKTFMALRMCFWDN